MLVVQAGKSKLKKITYEHFPSCSTHSNMLGPIKMLPFNQLWSLPWEFKRKLLGKKALQNNGGQEGDDDTEELDAKPNLKRTPESVEPVFYHGYPTVVYQDILEAHHVRYCIDLTPGDGAAALACYRLGIFYLGSRKHQSPEAARGPGWMTVIKTAVGPSSQPLVKKNLQVTMRTAANKRYPLAAARAGSWLTDHHAVSSFSGVRRSII